MLITNHLYRIAVLNMVAGGFPLCVCVCVCVYVHVSVCLCACVSVCVSVCACVGGWVYACPYVSYQFVPHGYYVAGISGHNF